MITTTNVDINHRPIDQFGGDCMIINGSSINMTSLSTQKSHIKIEEKLTIIEQTPGPNTNGNSWQDLVTFSDQSLLKSQNMFGTPSTDSIQDDDLYLDISEKDKEKIRLLQKLLESLTGKKVKFYLPKHFRGNRLSQTNSKNNELKQQPTGPQTSGPSITYERHIHYKEKASMTFSSNGIIQTADGREINFNINVFESRSFESSEHQFFQWGRMQDPLVINFDVDSAKLTDTKYEFDLLGTGQTNQINFVKNGSGFLAIDKNKDGVINDGTELFGPQTGNGFLELAAFDEDQNGWIDEKDSIFEDLLIWTKDSEGKDQLFALLTKDVGAIFLGNVRSQYDIKDTGNNLLGQINSTGIYAKESGGVGTIQHIDLVI